MKLLAIYLLIFKGYSVVKFNNEEACLNEGKLYGACSKPLGYNYSHDNGAWGIGNTALKAIINAYKETL